MKDELAASLAAAMGPGDQFLVLPVFYAGGTVKITITAEDWVAQLQQRGLAAKFVPDYAALERELAGARPGDAILGMGARDPDLPKFARKLASR
jgi:UDP-N-acetylmuramate--alanine ligase